ncbi:MAG: hypothetical protein J4F34_08000 [Gemmatimonadetes bacterium]|nr:hypothetical protein [Gemmatimonadota bacterium]
MIARPKPARALLAPLLLVVGAALPASTTAQSSPPPAETSWLSASMSEARRSPFHSPTSVPGPPLLGSVPVPTPVNRGSQPVDSANDPTFREVFLPTLLVTPLAEFAWFFGLLVSIDCREDCGPWFVLGTATLFLAPPTAAKLAGGSFGTALLGSALGIGANLLLLDAAGDGPAVVVALPFLHAGLTTWMSLLGR